MDPAQAAPVSYPVYQTAETMGSGETMGTVIEDRDEPGDTGCPGAGLHVHQSAVAGDLDVYDEDTLVGTVCSCTEGPKWHWHDYQGHDDEPEDEEPCCEDADEPGSHYHCARCRGRSSMMGHYSRHYAKGQLVGELHFCCPGDCELAAKETDR